ncbi:unnamed protein product [Sphagnum jensenii]|uniref:Pentatricopeptide repeat-containing protein n=1 Tax=Sphagnum jensenii TaxID=128206 RepID=A0ABP1BRK7_9BRYO
MSLWGIAWLTCAKCGTMEDECRVFSKMPLRNVISWNSVLVGFAMHWHGLVDEGMHCCGAMSSIYTISEELEHYTFMVYLGCAGHLQETENMSKSMP